MDRDIAILSNEGSLTVFEYGNYIIRFAAPYSLEYYIEVKEWDEGYLVVMAKYDFSDEPIAEYIDLVPVLEDLCIDKKEFLKPIREVRISYD